MMIDGELLTIVDIVCVKNICIAILEKLLDPDSTPSKNRWIRPYPYPQPHSNLTDDIYN